MCVCIHTHTQRQRHMETKRQRWTETDRHILSRVKFPQQAVSREDVYTPAGGVGRGDQK